MKKIELLVNFSKEFLLDRTLQQVNENIILSIKEDVLTLVKLVTNEYEQLFERPSVSEEDIHRFTILNQEILKDIQFLKDLCPKNKKGRKWNFINAGASDDDDKLFEQNTVNNNYESLKSLILKLEYQAKDHISSFEEISLIERGGVPSPENLSREFYENMVSNYSLLNKNFLYNVEDSDFFANARTQIEEIRTHLSELHKNSSFQYLRKIISTYKKTLKIMTDIVSVCLFIYGDKIVNEIESPTFAKKEDNENSQEISPHLIKISHDSVVFSKQFSRVKHRRPSISSDSFYLLVPEFLQNDKESNYGNSESTSCINKKKTNIPEQIKTPLTENNPTAEEFDHLSGRCFCLIF
jgi:hypothetical protein